MKKVIQILVVLIMILVPVLIIAQPMPYDPGVGGGTGGNPVGGGAPIDGGIILLLAMGISYSVKRYKDFWKKIL